MAEWTALSGMLVQLEPMAVCHVKGLAEAARSGASPFTLVPQGQAETHTYVAQARAEQIAGTSLAFTVIDQRDERIVGATRFKNLEWWTQDSTAGPDVVEIGNSWLCDTAQGSGINLEAKLLMLRYAFESWHVRRVSFWVDIRNHRSRAALEKLGATCEGERRALSPGLDGTERDVASYSVLAQEWPAVREIISMRLSLYPPIGSRRPNVPA
ncbi:GNAT family N-acetyltransferase [Streptomyces cinereoruber]|uniref:GNAT family N-acetyltransferase n=1 Tax=Streptomyces cinereoruber TaxID=67260 RepID=UPI0036609208